MEGLAGFKSDDQGLMTADDMSDLVAPATTCWEGRDDRMFIQSR
jgi:hypothetical protein